ncbi:MAG: catalase family protein [Pseudomonadota bacterium]
MKFSLKKAWKRISKFLVTWGRRLAYLVIAYALLALIIFGWQMAAGALRDPDADLVDDSELGKAQRQTDYAEIVESIRQAVNFYRTPTYERDAHSKPHGCVRAHFEVFDTQSIYNHGIFKQAGTYEAWVRFSNGSVPALADPKADARGMAIKVMDVPGEQLLPPLLAGRTQDFVMINSPAFFIRSIEGYRELERVTAIGKPFTYFLGEYYLNPFKWKLRELYLGLNTRKTAPSTPLSTQYFSMSPYKLGPHQMKFSAKACTDYQAPGINRDDPNFLRNAMKKVLKSQDACFQFMVQLRDPDARMPIQDTTVVWSEDDSPFVPVARVHIPMQDFDTAQQNEMCENMSFNPWHGTKELQPLSYINELRREVYLHTAAYRRVRNGVYLEEPNSWCDSLPEYCNNSSEVTTELEATVDAEVDAPLEGDEGAEIDN